MKTFAALLALSALTTTSIAQQAPEGSVPVEQAPVVAPEIPEKPAADEAEPEPEPQPECLETLRD